MDNKAEEVVNCESKYSSGDEANSDFKD